MACKNVILITPNERGEVEAWEPNGSGNGHHALLHNAKTVQEAKLELARRGLHLRYLYDSETVAVAEY